MTAVGLLGGDRVHLTFNDGATVDRDLTELLRGRVFERVRCDPAAFAELAVDPELGVLRWPGGADLDAEVLRYDELWREVVLRGPYPD